MTTSPELISPPDSLPQPEESALDLSPNGVWQRRPNESPASYTAFTTYLQLGPSASLQQVADLTGKSLSAVCALSARHHWMDRAAAWRAHVSHSYLADAQRERSRQTELTQMRDRLLRQEMWEDHQSLRAFCRDALHNLSTDPAKAKVAGYEIKGLYDLYFKLGRAATAPTGFSFDGPVPASPDFEEALKKSYGEPMPLDQMLDLMLLAHPQHEAMIREKFAAAGHPSPGSDQTSSAPTTPNGNGGSLTH